MSLNIKFQTVKIILSYLIAVLAISFSVSSCKVNQEVISNDEFNIAKDLLLVHFDFKTDVDDLHTAAALATLIAQPSYQDLNFHTVAGTYGIQEGLYVPPNKLMELSFKDNWTDAHKDMDLAVLKVKKQVLETLEKNGCIWIAEAGQSDFTALLIKAIQKDVPQIDLSKRIHVVQHSDWNEKSAAAKNLAFVKTNADYHKIPDGNIVGNGTPGFQNADFSDWQQYIKNPELFKIWKLAIELGNQYNGNEGRYNNKSVESGGLDFSDLSEVFYILKIHDINDIEAFFTKYGQ